MVSDEEEELRLAIALSLQVDPPTIPHHIKSTRNTLEGHIADKGKSSVIGSALHSESVNPRQLSFIEQRRIDEAARLERIRKRDMDSRSPAPSEPSLKRQRVEESAPPIAVKRIKTNRASDMQFAKGAIRLTRTPGRRTESYCVLLDDLVDSHALKTAFVHSFYIGQDELFKYFPFAPFGNPRPGCNIYIGRDLFMDDEGLGACGLTREANRNMSDYEWAKVCSKAAKYHKKQYGENYKAVYTRMEHQGCAHSKILILIYEGFLRVVITSANIDTVFSDNHWYIHDFAKLDTKCTKRPAFEKELLAHLSDLACPTLFLEDIRGRYDFSSTEGKVKLVVSKPTTGSYKGLDAMKYGSLRLRNVVSQILDGREDKMNFEVCAGSVGRLEATGKNGNPGFLQGFLESCSGGIQEIDPTAPPLKVVYPTKQTVSRSAQGEIAASNIGSHVKWDNAPIHIKRLYHDYRSKDLGMMFHQKIIIGRFDDARLTDPPVYIYIGSANISAAAWGVVATDKRGQEGALRLSDIRNYECGVVVRGEDLKELLGDEKWDSVIPYQTPLIPYGQGDRPWNFVWSS